MENEIVLELDNEEIMTDYFCYRGDFTNVTFYMTTLSLDEAADGLNYENEVLDGGSFAERMQRNINVKRAKEEIYEDYLLHDGTRFFNALIATFIPESNDDKGYLEEKNLGKDFVKLSVKKTIKKLVLDGQHRLYALRELRADILSKKINDQTLKSIKIPVIFVTFSNLDNALKQLTPIRDDIIKETRSIFIALNKTAKKIDKYTALITDDTDLSAVSARKLIETGDIDELYVKWAVPNSSLSQTDPYFTTLSLINDYFDICESNVSDLAESDNSFLSDEEKNQLLQEYYFDFVEDLGFAPNKLVEEFFKKISFFEEWKTTLVTAGVILPKQPEMFSFNPEQKKAIKQMRQKNILATVAGQKALFMSIVNTYNRMGATTDEKSDNIFSKVNKLLEGNFFNRDNAIWELLLVRNDKNKSMIHKNVNVLFAEKLISIVLTNETNHIKKFCEDINYELGTKLQEKQFECYLEASV